MRVLPVIDLKQGVVVRGVAGRRETYRPVESQLAADASPEAVAAAFAELGLREAYVADLDAIAGGEPSWESLQRIARHQSRIWLDPGIRDVERAAELVAFAGECPAVTGLIVGLESVRSPAQLERMFRAIGPERAIFSLDLQHGRPLNESHAWRDRAPLAIAQQARRIGFERLIVLDLAAVGMGRGVSVGPLCRQIRRTDPSAELIAGGGVRNLEDLRALAKAGCQAGLVASAIHDGRLGGKELAEAHGWTDLWSSEL